MICDWVCHINYRRNMAVVWYVYGIWIRYNYVYIYIYVCIYIYTIDTHTHARTHTHTTLLHATFSRTTCSHSYTTISQLPHAHTTLSHATVSPSYITTFSHTHNSSTYNFCTYRSSTTSFVLPPFPVPLKLLFGRSWLVGLSGPLISSMPNGLFRTTNNTPLLLLLCWAIPGSERTVGFART